MLKQHMYAEEFMPALGHCVTLLLALSENEQLRSLRIEAIHSLVELTQCNKKGGAFINLFQSCSQM